MEPLSIEERDLAEKYYGIIQDKLRGFIRKFPRFRDEFSSAANEALVNGVKRYKKRENEDDESFKCYLYYRLKFAIFDCLKKEIKRGITEISQSKARELIVQPLSEFKFADKQDEDWLQYEDFVQVLFKDLKKREREACLLYFIQKKTQKEIAEICNTYESVINARLKRSKEKLKNVEINWR